MRGRRRRQRGARPVEHGQVLCPLQGEDRDTDACVQCGFLRSIRTEDGVTLLTCRPPARTTSSESDLRYHLPTF